jgi:hypothetical protein
MDTDAWESERQVTPSTLSPSATITISMDGQRATGASSELILLSEKLDALARAGQALIQKMAREELLRRDEGDRIEGYVACGRCYEAFTEGHECAATEP